MTTLVAPKAPISPSPTPLPTYEVHKLAYIFPEIDEAALYALRDDIKAHGQREPIWLYEGKIIDGRHRYQACQMLGRDVLTRNYPGDDPIGFVLSANLHRRHLNESQRAMVAAKLSNLEQGANQHTKQGTSIEVASKLLNVGRASIERARIVLGSDDPGLIADVEKGNTSVSNAANTAKGKTGKTKRNKDTPKQRAEDFKTFKEMWQGFDNYRQHAFVKSYKEQIAELLEDVESEADASAQERDAA